MPVHCELDEQPAAAQVALSRPPHEAWTFWQEPVGTHWLFVQASAPLQSLAVSHSTQRDELPSFRQWGVEAPHAVQLAPQAESEAQSEHVSDVH